MHGLLKALIVILLLPVLWVIGLMVFTQTTVQAVSWNPPQAPDMHSGPYAMNTSLNEALVHGRYNLLQPESLAVGPRGLLYTGMSTGEIVQFSPDVLALPDNPGTTPFALVANTLGRPLGMVFHPDGFLVVADAQKGLLKVTLSGEVTVLSTQADGLAFKFVDDVAVSADGQYAYFSDASSKFDLNEYVLDILEHGANGRLLRYSFSTGETEVLLSGLQFANGVALAQDDSYVLVNETGAYRIIRYWLSGPKKGKPEVFAENLPGFPDNVRTDAQGNHWVAIPSLRTPLIDKLADMPALRNQLAKVLAKVEFPVQPYAMALAFDPEGKVVANLQAKKARDYYYYITQVTPFDGKLFFGSVHINGIASIANPLLP